MDGRLWSGESLEPRESGVWRLWSHFRGEKMMVETRTGAMGEVRRECPQEEGAGRALPKVSSQGSCNGTEQNSRPGDVAGTSRGIHGSLELRDTDQVCL